jgi:hypothetical protein
MFPVRSKREDHLKNGEKSNVSEGICPSATERRRRDCDPREIAHKCKSIGRANPTTFRASGDINTAAVAASNRQKVEVHYGQTAVGSIEQSRPCGRVREPFIAADSQTSANLKNALRSERRSVVVGEQTKSEATIKASEQAPAHKPTSADGNK